MRHFFLWSVIFSIISCSSLQRRSSFQLKPYAFTRLSNGLEVLFVNDPALPTFSLSLMLKAGASRDPQGKEGLAFLTSNLLEKGTKNKNAIQLAEAFSQLGSEFSVDVDYDSILFSSSTLSFKQNDILNLFWDVILNPRFSQSELRRLKSQHLALLKKIVDRPPSFASREFRKFLYKTHPYGRFISGTLTSVKSIRKKDINKFYLKYFRPNNAILAVTGNFDRNQVLQKLEDLTKKWTMRPQTEMVYPPLGSIQGHQIKLITKKDLAQAQVIFGHYGVKRKNSDFLALQLATTVLGGAFHSRLMEEIRIKRGLTYGIYSYFSSDKDVGQFVIRGATRNNKVGELIKETLRQLKIFRQRGITKEELKMAKALLKGSFPRRIETSEMLAHSILSLKVKGVSVNYLKTYIDQVDRLTLNQINRAIRKYIHPDSIKILVYAPEEPVKKQLQGLGELQVQSYKEVPL